MSGYLLASDLDGTLVQWPTPGVSDYDREAIERFRAAGNRFVVITGRCYGGAYWGMQGDDFPEIDAMLAMNGAYAMKTDGSEIFDKRTKYVGGTEFVNFIKDSGAYYMYLDIGREHFIVDFGQPLDAKPEEIKTIEEVAAIESFTAFTCGFESVERTTKVAREVGKRFGHMVTPLQNAQCLDMPGVGINKGTGALFAAQTFGIDEDKIFTVGDNFNDMDMIAAYHGNAISHAPEALRDKAERVVEHIGDVIYYIMEEKEK